MNAIFSTVDEKVFKLISNYEIAKEAWDILTIAHQGIKKVREEHICQLTTLLENISMKDEETIEEYGARIYDIFNEFSLGETIDNARLVSKVLRTP